jgi:hypothetical protein
MEIGEVYFPEKSSWVRADVWSAKKFLSEHESRRKLMVKVLDREIARYSLCVKEKREVGILLRPNKKVPAIIEVVNSGLQ